MITHTNETDSRIQALAKLLLCDPLDIQPLSYDYYGLPIFSAEGGEYAIGTDSEADEAVIAYIKDSIWAFNASLILSMCDLPSELEDGIKELQEKKREDANEALLALVEKLCGLPFFVTYAVMADGRGHFLSSYDGEEREEGEFFIYRTN
jgi:hypothetical protein